MRAAFPIADSVFTPHGRHWISPSLRVQVVPRVQGSIPKRDKKKKKEPMGVAESFTFLAKNPYIRDLAFLVVAYGISINLVEVTWKSKIKAQFPNPNDYSAFMGDFSTATGAFRHIMRLCPRFICRATALSPRLQRVRFATDLGDIICARVLPPLPHTHTPHPPPHPRAGAVTFTMMIISRWIFSKFGWGMAALITPTVLLITGAVLLTPMHAQLFLWHGPVVELRRGAA
jgi:hypothetical protein